MSERRLIGYRIRIGASYWAKGENDAISYSTAKKEARLFMTKLAVFQWLANCDHHGAEAATIVRVYKRAKK